MSRPKTPCPRCNKGFHWAKECYSKCHKDGRPLEGGPMPIVPQNSPVNSNNLQVTANPLSGNWQWGQPRAIQIMEATSSPFQQDMP